MTADVLAASCTIQLQVGFENVCKVGYWTPVQIRIAAGDQDVRGKLELLTPDGDGIDCLYVEQPTEIVVPAGEQKQFMQYVRMGRRSGHLEVRLVDEQTQIAAARTVIGSDVKSLFSTQHWMLVIGGSLDLEQLVRRYQQHAPHAVHVTEVSDLTQLPDAWFGFEGVDTIMLTTGDLSRIEQLSADQLSALERWVRMGGTLLISVGANGPKLAGEGGPLRRFAPSTITETTVINEAPGIESFARADQPLQDFTLSVLNQPEGDIATYVEGRAEGQRPAIVRRGYSFGKVTFLAFDLDTPPWNEWTSRNTVLDALLFEHTDSSDDSSGSQGRMVQTIGYDDLSGQLRSALDYFPGSEDRRAVTVVTFWTVFPLLLIYIALLGPGDYFFLHRLLKRMEWTWITFPLLIIATSTAIYLLGIYWRGGSNLRVNQVDVVDVDPQHGIMRGITFAQLYSPTSAAYQLAAVPHPAVAVKEGTSDESGEGSLLTWQGLPGKGLGAYDTDHQNAEILPSTAYRIVRDTPASTTVDQLLLPTAASKALVSRWWREQGAAAPPVIRVDKNEILHGDIENPLSLPLTDAMVVHQRWVYRLDRTFEPGATMDLDNLTRRDLEWRLTRRHVLQSSTSYASTPWDPQSRDVQRIMELMMFHDAAGGKDYTGLALRYQSFMDMTEQLQLGRAILVGRCAEPAVHLRSGEASLTDTAEQKWTWYRIVLPVKREAPAPTAGDNELSGQ